MRDHFFETQLGVPATTPSARDTTPSWLLVDMHHFHVYFLRAGTGLYPARHVCRGRELRPERGQRHAQGCTGFRDRLWRDQIAFDYNGKYFSSAASL